MENTFDHFPSVAAETECNGGLVTTYTALGGFAVMPFFPLANAGVPVSFGDVVGPVALAVFAGFVFGKPAGVLAFSWLAVRSGIAIRASDLSWELLAGGSRLAGIGFTMALFIAQLAFSRDLIDAVNWVFIGIRSFSPWGSCATGLVVSESSRGKTLISTIYELLPDFSRLTD